MDNTPKIKPMETPRDARFNPPGQVKTVNASITATHTGSLALILATLSEDGTKMDCPVYDIIAKKWAVGKADARHWYHSSLNWKLGAIKDTFLQSDARLVHMLCIKKDGTCDEKALAACFKGVLELAKTERGSLHISSALLSQLPQLTTHLEEAKGRGITTFIYLGDSKEGDKKGNE